MGQAVFVFGFGLLGAGFRFFAILLRQACTPLPAPRLFVVCTLYSPRGAQKKKQKNKGESVGCFCVGLRFFGLFYKKSCCTSF
jgi:hypothetical protein